MMLCGLFSASPALEKPLPATSNHHNQQDSPDSSIETMMRAIEGRPKPVIDFAITQLNAELILFLHYALAWKLQWSTKDCTGWDAPGDEVARVTCYAHAALIYFTLVDEKAYYPVNMHPAKRNSLAVLFRCASLVPSSPRPTSDTPSTLDSDTTVVAEDHYDDNNSRPVTPWDALKLDDTSSRIVSQQQMTQIKIDSSEAFKKIQVLPADATRRLTMAREDSTTNAMALAMDKQIDAPDDMHMRVFDDAIKEVKMQAYHNVWLPFVDLGKYDEAYL